ncbi:MAG: hypothetical protein Q8P57_02410 [Candidatus Pacearchaeota archaeon]|nr:hypothetical protein [Candidatus Pacearchaeota archaeon]
MEFEEYYRTFWQSREKDFRTQEGVSFYKDVTKQLYDNIGGSEAPLLTLGRESTIESLFEIMGSNPLNHTPVRNL